MMSKSSRTYFILILAFGTIVNSSNAFAQWPHIPLINVLDKAESYLKRNKIDSSKYSVIEVSQYNTGVHQKSKKFYQAWFAQTVEPYYYGVAVSPKDERWEISQPAVLRGTPFNYPSPKISLRSALSLAQNYAEEKGLIQSPDQLHTGYLITTKKGSQFWHILSNRASVYVFMDGSVQETPEM